MSSQALAGRPAGFQVCCHRDRRRARGGQLACPHERQPVRRAIDARRPCGCSAVIAWATRLRRPEWIRRATAAELIARIAAPHAVRDLYGGFCLPKDVPALVKFGQNAGCEMRLARATHEPRRSPISSKSSPAAARAPRRSSAPVRAAGSSRSRSPAATSIPPARASTPPTSKPPWTLSRRTWRSENQRWGCPNPPYLLQHIRAHVGMSHGIRACVISRSMYIWRNSSQGSRAMGFS